MNGVFSLQSDPVIVIELSADILRAVLSISVGSEDRRRQLHFRYGVLYQEAMAHR